MIEFQPEVKVTKSEARVLVCPFTPQGVVFGYAGIEIVNTYRELTYHYRQARMAWSRAGISGLPPYWVYEAINRKQLVIFHVPDRAPYQEARISIRRGMVKLARDQQKLRFSSLAIPVLCHDEEPLLWDEIKQDLVGVFSESDMRVIVHG